MPQHRPGAMIESPCLVEHYRQWCKHLLHAPRELRIARRGILHLIQILGEAAEVMNRSWRRSNRDACLRNKPVRRDRKYGLWFWTFASNASPCFGVAVVQQSIHWITVAE